MAKKINVRGARPIGDQVVEEVNIYINGFHPESKDLDEVGRLSQGFKKDAYKIFDGLRSLPGGTFDQLLILMLQKTASSFIVPHDFRDASVRAAAPSMLALLEKALQFIRAEEKAQYKNGGDTGPGCPWFLAYDLGNQIEAEIDKARGESEATNG